jgi:WD40 repeat protein
MMHSEGMSHSGRFAIALLIALGGSACESKSTLLTPRDGGGGAGISGASGTGGSSAVGGGATGTGGGASGTDGGVGGPPTGGRGGAAAVGGASGTGGGGASGPGGGGASGTGGGAASGSDGGGASGTGGGASGTGGGASGTGGRGGSGTAGSGGRGGTAGTPLPTLDAPCDWRGAGDAIHLTFTPDGKLLLAASGNYVRAFDATTGQHAFISRWHPASLIGVATSPDGRWFATFALSNGFTAYGAGAAVWQIGDPRQGKMLVSDQSVDAIGFSSDSTLLAVAMWSSKTIAIFDLATLSMVASINKNELGSASALMISADGYRFTYQGSQTFVVASGTPWFGERFPTGNLPRPATYFDWSPVSNLAASLEGAGISVNYQIPNLSPGGIGSSDGVAFTAVALSHGGYQVAAGQRDGRVSLWQLASSPFYPATMLLPAFTTQVGQITAVAFSPDDSRVASASEDGTIYVRRVSDGSPLWHAEGPSPSVWGTPILAVSPANGRLLAFSGAYSPMTGSPLSVPWRGYVMDLDDDVVRGVLDPGPSFTNAIQFGTCAGSADATAMACPDDIIRYSALDGSQVMTGTPTTSAARGALALAPDHSRVVESIYPGGLWSWPLPAGAPGQPFSAVPSSGLVAKLLFSGDGGTLASVTTSMGVAPIKAWDGRSGTSLGIWGMTLQGAAETFLDDVAISYAGDLIAAVGDFSPSIALVRPRVGTLQWVTVAAGDNAGFSAVALSPDGTRMAVSPTYLFAPGAAVARHGLAVFGTDGRPIARTASYRPYGYRNLIAMRDNRTLLVGEDDGIVSIWCLP